MRCASSIQAVASEELFSCSSEQLLLSFFSLAANPEERPRYSRMVGACVSPHAPPWTWSLVFHSQSLHTYMCTCVHIHVYDLYSCSSITNVSRFDDPAVQPDSVNNLVVSGNKVNGLIAPFDCFAIDIEDYSLDGFL